MASEDLLVACKEAAEILMCDINNDDPCDGPDVDQYCNPCYVRMLLTNAAAAYEREVYPGGVQ